MNVKTETSANLKGSKTLTNATVEIYRPQPGENPELCFQVRATHMSMGSVQICYTSKTDADNAANFINEFGVSPTSPTERERRAQLEAGISFAAVKSDLIAARERIEQGKASAAVLHMKWAIEKLLPDGQQYCSQTLPDDDPEKTIQGYLDNIVQAVSLARAKAAEPKQDRNAIDAIFGDLTNCRDCGKPIPVTANQCIHCSHFQ